MNSEDVFFLLLFSSWIPAAYVRVAVRCTFKRSTLYHMILRGGTLRALVCCCFVKLSVWRCSRRSDDKAGQDLDILLCKFTTVSHNVFVPLHIQYVVLEAGFFF